MLHTYDSRSRGLRQEDHSMFHSSLDSTEFWNSLGYRVRPCLPQDKGRGRESESGKGVGKVEQSVTKGRNEGASSSGDRGAAPVNVKEWAGTQKELGSPK